MIEVSASTKSKYQSSAEKHLIVTFPDLNLTISSSDILSESFELMEELESETYLRFTGCNSSQMNLSLANITTDLKGQYVEVSIQSENTDIIPLFKGYVDEHKIKDYTTSTSDIKAFDILYTLSSVDIAQWYIHLWDNIESITLKDFRDSLFEYLDLDVVSTTLPNDELEFVKQYSPQQMNALDVIKSICQINGVYGIINRNGLFEFRVLPKIDITASYQVVPYYKSLEYQRWGVVGINKVTVRQTEDEAGGSWGSGNNVYIIQGNIFTLNLEPETLVDIATNVYPNVEGRSYVAYKSEVDGYPWIEVGDIQTYNVYDYQNNSFSPQMFYVINRDLKGIQALIDNQNAEGEQYRNIFISNLNTRIDTIKDQIESIEGKLNSLSLKYVMFYNETAIDIADGETKAIASNEFAVSQASQVRIELEYLIECTTTETENNDYVINNDLKVKVLYEYDGTFIDSRQPIETFQDGKHILHNYYVINIPDQQAHFWRVFLECEGGSVHIDIMQAQNTIFGLGTLVGDLWDGTIRVDDTAYPLHIRNRIAPTNFSDSVSSEFIVPDENTFNETVNGLRIRFRSIGSFTDSVSFNEIVERWIIDTTTPTTSNPNFVKKSAGKFEMFTEWSHSSISETIDDGYCTKTEIEVADIDVTDVRIIL